MSYAFWRDYLSGYTLSDERGKRIRQAALGYLRTYHHLIQYESDLRIAQDRSLCLVPTDITWEQFCNFSSDLGSSIDDRDASPRYSYGEIRLTRLNLYAPLLLGRSHFQRVEYQYGSYFARFYGPLLFVFGIASVVLSGLEVIVSVEDGGAGWMGATVWVSVTAIVASCTLLLTLGLLLVYKVAREWRFAIRDRRRRLEERAAGRAVVDNSMV
ncbi:uncharacterized protein DNG_08018 [Cephalotrichum gorgonifer]|uniref:Uncharacterized protein n=1 Tax=Cephalotrichum gorgonifer TaxID=2041049 RepID=A0AAE8N2P5_9PEZI|nr:uncharacterized protein DNG_08018 [Cephalotrichum gorgonifer]